MRGKLRSTGALLCVATAAVVIFGITAFLIGNEGQGVRSPQGVSLAASESDVGQNPVERAAAAAQEAGVGELLTPEFLRICEQESPGICGKLAEKLQSRAAFDQSWFWQLSGKTLHYYEALARPADNVYDTGRDHGPAVLAFTGDVNFADDWNIMRHYTGTAGITDCFGESLLEEMRSADVLLCNNEFSISDRGSPMPGKRFTFRAKTDNVSMWHQLGADIVGLANNHCFDYGEEAFIDTLDTLTEAGIPYVGAGRNIQEAMEPRFFLAGGMKIGYVACTRAEKHILTPGAGENSPGVLRCYEPELAEQAIRQAKEQCDYLAVYVHWGTEGSTVLEQAQTELAGRFQQAGADLIVGAHPHVLQGTGWRKDTPVIYSLGNFWFNMKSMDTALLKVTINQPGAAGAEVQLLPCVQTGGRVSLLEDTTERQRVWNSLNTVAESGYFDENGVLRKSDVV